MKRTFDLGSIWFVINQNEDKIKWIEEHDVREGGAINKPENVSWEDFFVNTVVNRCSGEDYKKEIEKLARDFFIPKTKILHINLKNKNI